VKRFCAAAGVGIALVLSASQVLAEAPASVSVSEPVQGPSEIVRTLQLLQDQIAVGSLEAQASQRGLLSILEKRMGQLAPSTWSETKNIHAAVIFGLSGGSPKLLRAVFAAPGISERDRDLVQGSLAYVEGRQEEARRYLLDVKAEELPVGLACQIAFVQAALLAATDPAKSMRLLDYVRLEAPGTLLDEASLRRQIMVAQQIADFAHFDELAGEYLRRFQHSIYAGNFKQRLLSALIEFDYQKDPGRFPSMLKLLTALEPAAQREMLLTAAQTSIESGRVHSAALISEAAEGLSANAPQALVRAKLYRAAALVVSPGSTDSGIKALRGIDRKSLDGRDAKLLDAALGVGVAIRTLPGEPAEKRQAGDGVAVKLNEVHEQLPALKRAEQALAGADKLLQR
jgi:chemotaxis protein MotC